MSLSLHQRTAGQFAIPPICFKLLFLALQYFIPYGKKIIIQELLMRACSKN